MRIKYSPSYFSHDTDIKFIDENTIRIDGENSEVLYARA